ncbi:MAG: tRNA (adenosine(37)-N6)-dimethylallyltransferase MiaA [Elusimicrobia bacterium CG06_land_8_20_14_3_00_38_11]|nr:MAG: tRNA (adenosine(37)-N6)-dimethylallyltransferase MiaA [Elusimicrobia bacterium CG06_land_8_20_14_3_00_38_11]
MKNMETVIVILGPTASGKTGVAVKLAKKINGEIISADSRQIYKYMDIGTNKPSKKQLKSVPHHLLNIIEPTENFTAGDFVKFADKKIKKIFKRKKIPLIVGGTGLYIKALIDGLIEIPSNKEIRIVLTDYYKKMGLIHCNKLLEKFDPETAKTIDKQNPVRVLRAIEICLLTGKKFSELKKQTKKSDYKYILFGLKIGRDELYKRINCRVDKMIKSGLFNEAKKLVKKYSKKSAVLNATIGYSEILDYMDGKSSKENAVNLIKQNTRHYAKRQMTWFKKDSRIIWLESKNSPLKKILNYLKKSDII